MACRSPELGSAGGCRPDELQFPVADPFEQFVRFRGSGPHLQGVGMLPVINDANRLVHCGLNAVHGGMISSGALDSVKFSVRLRSPQAVFSEKLDPRTDNYRGSHFGCGGVIAE